jgi:hypothetical protein
MKRTGMILLRNLRWPRGFSSAGRKWDLSGMFGLRPAHVNFRSLLESRDHPFNCRNMWDDFRPGFGSKIFYTPSNGSDSIFKTLFTYSWVYLRHMIWSYVQFWSKIRSHVAGSSGHFNIRNWIECKCSAFQAQIIWVVEPNDWMVSWRTATTDWKFSTGKLSHVTWVWILPHIFWECTIKKWLVDSIIKGVISGRNAWQR